MAAAATNQHHVSANGQYLFHRYDPIAILTMTVATATFISTAWFANATFSNRSFAHSKAILKNVLHIDISDTLTVLAVLQGVLSFLMGILLDNVLEIIQWSLMGRDNGLPALSILGLNPATGAMGTAGILCSGMATKTDRFWAFSK